MRIGIIGAGSVGGTLARAWASTGHRVALATRMPDDPKLATLALSIGPNGTAGAVPRVVEHSEVVVLATPWTAVVEMPGLPVDWSGKIVIDCTNPLRRDFTWLEDDYEVSAAERIAAWAEGAAVFKTLNHTGANNMANPV
jgi:predicted dinucleotide-binding enzyme